MGICAIPVVVCVIIKKLLGKACHRELHWIAQICCGLGYVIIVLAILVCIPVVYLLLPIILSPLLCYTAGRQRFKLIIKNSAIFIVKVVWFYHVLCKRQAQELAYEREKHRPLPLQLRRRLSHTPCCPETQLKSSFFTKLPFEIRLQIYKEVIVGDGDHVHVVVHSPMKHPYRAGDIRAEKNAMRAGKIRGYRCNHAFDYKVGTPPVWHLVEHYEAEVVYAGYNVIVRTHPSILFRDRGSGPIALVGCCKQMYLEAIDLLYSECRSLPFTLLLTRSQYFQVCRLSHFQVSHRHLSSCRAYFLTALHKFGISKSATIVPPLPFFVRVRGMIDALPYTHTGCIDVPHAICILGQS